MSRDAGAAVHTTRIHGWPDMEGVLDVAFYVTIEDNSQDSEDDFPVPPVSRVEQALMKSIFHSYYTYNVTAANNGECLILPVPICTYSEAFFHLLHHTRRSPFHCRCFII